MARNRQQVIDAIRQLNPTAATTFLDAFQSDALERYLLHLEYQAGPRDWSNHWVRPGETPAAVTRHSA